MVTTLGSTIRKAREAQGLSIEQAAAQAGIEPDRWQSFEIGRDEPSFCEGMVRPWESSLAC
jgi:transcriptional regulator with XRE-family HTH domain